MVEITESHAAIIACLDTAEVLDCIPDHDGAFHARVAHEELLLIGAATEAAELLAGLADYAPALLRRALLGEAGSGAAGRDLLADAIEYAEDENGDSA